MKKVLSLPIKGNFLFIFFDACDQVDKENERKKADRLLINRYFPSMAKDPSEIPFNVVFFNFDELFQGIGKL